MKQHTESLVINNKLYQYGITDAFVNGLYEGSQSLDEIRKNGDFGVGAPGMTDGELTFYNGRAYQTKANGQTMEAPDSVKTALAFVTFFKADTTLIFNKISSRKEVFDQIDTFLKNKNGTYAIRISGIFSHMKTRAFPPVDKKPFPPLATMLDRQHFFEFNNVQGVLIGFKIPAYLAGINIEGYHFHFLSDDFNGGGHMIDFLLNNAKVEIATLTDFRLEAPKTTAFTNYNFKTNNNPEVQKVEKGN